MHATIAAQRQRTQRITGAALRSAADVVSWFGAVQAQEYPHARWALGLRMPAGATDAAVQRAFDEGRILRTHVMRPTWHFVTPADIRWLLALTGPRVQRVMSSYHRHLGLEPPLFREAARVFERALGEGAFLTRKALGLRLARTGLVLDSMRLAHVVMHAELEGLICSGPRQGSQFTYALLATRAPGAEHRSRDEALAELARRFLRSHGPATIRDFVWWSGLTTPDARRGFDMNRARQAAEGGLSYWSLPGPPPRRRAPDAAHLLPIYDEYIVAYRDRVAVPHGPPLAQARPRPTSTFSHALVLDGHVAGMWRVARRDEVVDVEVSPLRRLSAGEREDVSRAATRYGRFLCMPVSLSFAGATR